MGSTIQFVSYQKSEVTEKQATERFTETDKVFTNYLFETLKENEDLEMLLKKKLENVDENYFLSKMKKERNSTPSKPPNKFFIFKTIFSDIVKNSGVITGNDVEKVKKQTIMCKLAALYYKHKKADLKKLDEVYRICKRTFVQNSSKGVEKTLHKGKKLHKKKTSSVSNKQLDLVMSDKTTMINDSNLDYYDFDNHNYPRFNTTFNYTNSSVDAQYDRPEYYFDSFASSEAPYLFFSNEF